MGDRATIQLFVDDENFSPILYLHWAGDRAPAILQEAAPIMRKSDTCYAFARLVGVAHNATNPDQGLSLGVWPTDAILHADEQSDNGHFLVNMRTGEVEHFGGYTGDMEPLEFGQF